MKKLKLIPSILTLSITLFLTGCQEEKHVVDNTPVKAELYQVISAEGRNSFTITSKDIYTDWRRSYGLDVGDVIVREYKLFPSGAISFQDNGTETVIQPPYKIKRNNY